MRDVVNGFCMFPALLRHRSEGRLYHLTDTHWNDRGALAGYRAIVESLVASAPSWPEQPPGEENRTDALVSCLEKLTESLLQGWLGHSRTTMTIILPVQRITIRLRQRIASR